jgi:hypothetical protein
MIKPEQFSKIAMAALVGSAVLFSHTESASAGWFTKEEYLGRLSYGDNEAYMRAQGKMALPQSPPNRDKLCQWKHRGSNVFGKPVSKIRWMETDCYRWRWFWQ